MTTLERLARCPWNTFLEKLLGLENYPDPFDVLPTVDPLRIGAMIHRALERIATPTGVEIDLSLEELAVADGVPVDWSAVEIESELRAAADELVEELGTPVPGFAAALARAGRPFLEVARRVDEQSALPVVGVEVFSKVELPTPIDERLALHFRADRVERMSTGLRWIDFKTGRPFSDKKKAETREGHLHDRIRAGEALQAGAYAHARGGADEGSYIFLRPDVPADDAERRVTLRASDEAVAELFRDAVARLAGAWYEGTMVPRLSEAKVNRTPPACDRCEVAEACLQGDSGARTRLRDWFAAGLTGDRPDEPYGPLLRKIWFGGDVPEPGADR